MTSLYTHLSWFIILLLSFLASLFCSFYVSFIDTSLFLSLFLFNTPFIELSLSFSIDFISSWFFSTVLFISCIVIVYSYNYITPYSKSGYFLWFTVLFVISILFVISMNNLFFIILGWDGLGLISFFLIVYYQNSSSISSALFTVLINRIGDCFFLSTIVLFSFFSFDFTPFGSDLLLVSSLFFLLVTFITNSAIFPFSPWLPAAMAAPTPISALVHSSTLVTSGLFLMIRFSHFIYSSIDLLNFLVICSIFTSFYAGLNTIFEKDLKKLIALSTLSHLGFIGLSFSLGLLYLSFFHLLAHALFNSLLFITIGDIIINISHYQDIRYLSNGYVFTPASSFFINVSLFNLLGLPSLSGFFSNDLILEDILYSNCSFIFYFLVLVNVFFTYYYTYSLLSFSFQSVNLSPYSIIHSPLIGHSVLLFFLSFVAVVFGFFFLQLIFSSVSFLVVPSIANFTPFLISTLFFIFLLLVSRLFTFRSIFLNSYLSQIIFLAPFISSVLSSSYLSFSLFLNNSFEVGFFNSLVNSYPFSFSSFLGNFLFSSASLNPLLFSLFSFLLTLFFFIF